MDDLDHWHCWRATLKEYFPAEFETYAEPLAGSAAFLFRIAPSKAKISDINPDLYDFCRL